jgi:hypothetical protein
LQQLNLWIISRPIEVAGDLHVERAQIEAETRRAARGSTVHKSAASYRNQQLYIDTSILSKVEVLFVKVTMF